MKTTKNNELEKLKSVLTEKVKSENDSRYINLSSDELMKIASDSSLVGKYIFWVLREYFNNHIQRFEDMGRVKQALTLFKNNLKKFTEEEKQLKKMTFQELEKLVSPYQDVLTQNEIKRTNKEKIWSEIETIYEGSEGRIYVPKTEQASIFLGQGTKWCTASINNNMFDYYNKKGKLYVFVLPEKDEQGREIKYQLHFETNQFMNSEDNYISLSEADESLKKILFALVENLSDDMKKIYFQSHKLFHLILGNQVDKFFDNLSNKEKIKFFVSNDFFCTKFCEKDFYKDKYDELIDLKINYSNENAETLREYLSIPIDLVTEDICFKAVIHNNDYIFGIPQNFMNLNLDFIEKLALRNDVSIDTIFRYIHNFYPNNPFKNVLEKNKTNKDLFWKGLVEKIIKSGLCAEKINNSRDFFAKIPNELKTQEMCEIALKKDGCDVGYVPENLITEKLCEIAVKETPFSFEYIHPKHITYELCKTAVENNSVALEHIPDKFKTLELCKIALKENPFSYNHFSDEHKTQEMLEFAISSEGILISEISSEMLTYELCKLAVENSGYAFGHIPEKYITQELCLKAASKKGFNFIHVPKHLITQELCEIALENSSLNRYSSTMAYVPKKFMTYDFCKKAIILDEESFPYIPKEFVTKELCELAVRRNGRNIHYIPKEFITKELCEIAVSKSGRNIRCVPKEFLTPEICLMAVKKDENSLYDIPKDFITKNLIIEGAKKNICVLNAVAENPDFKSEKNIFENISKSDLIDIFEANLKPNNLAEKYSFEESIMMLFSGEKNVIKESFPNKKIKSFYKEIYLEIMLEKLDEKFQNNNVYQLK